MGLDFSFLDEQAPPSGGGLDFSFLDEPAQAPSGGSLDFSFLDEPQDKQDNFASRPFEPMRPYDHLPEMMRPQVPEVGIPMAPPTPVEPKPLSYRPLEMDIGRAEQALGQAQGIGSADSARGYYTPGGARSIFDAEEMLTAKEQAGTADRGYHRGGNPLGDAIIKAVGDSTPWAMAMGAFDVASRLSKEAIFDPTMASLKAVENTYADNGNVLEAFKNYQVAGAKEMLNAFRGDEPSLHETMQRGPMVHQAAVEKMAGGELDTLPDPILNAASKAAGVPRSPEFDRQVSGIAWEIGMDALNAADFVGALRHTGKLDELRRVGEAAQQAEKLRQIERNASTVDDAWARAQDMSGVMPERLPEIGPQGQVADTVRADIQRGNIESERIREAELVDLIKEATQRAESAQSPNAAARGGLAEMDRRAAQQAQPAVEPDIPGPGDEIYGASRGGDVSPGAPRPQQTPPPPKDPTAKQGLGQPEPVPQSTKATLTEVKSVQDINRDIQDTIKGVTGTTIAYRKRLSRAGNEVGLYHNSRNLVEVIKNNDLDVVIHEVGHALDKHYGLSDFASGEVSRELLGMGRKGLSATQSPVTGAGFRTTEAKAELARYADEGREGSLSSFRSGQGSKRQRAEGFGEFFRDWMTNPERAKKEAPNSYQAFEEFLEARPPLAKSLRSHQQDIQIMQKGDPLATGTAKIKQYRPDTRTNANDAIAKVADRYRHLEALVERIESDGRKLKPLENPYVQARMLSGLDNVLDQFMDTGPLRFEDRSRTGTRGLKAILSDVSDDVTAYKDFQNYLVGKRAQELEARGIQSGFTPEEIEAFRTKRISDFDNAKFEEMAQEIYKWQDDVLQYAVDGGYLTPDQLKNIKELNKSYVPFQRIKESQPGVASKRSGTGGGKGVQPGAANSLKTIKGSTSEIIDPFESMVENLMAITKNTERNKLGQILVDHWDKGSPHIGEVMVALREPPAAWRQIEAGDAVTIRGLRESLEKAGVDLERTGLGDGDLRSVIDLMPDTWIREMGMSLPDGVIRVKMPDGSYRFMEILDPGLYKAYTASEEDSLKFLQNWAARTFITAPGQVLRTGATQINPFFPLKNLLKDLPTYAIVSRFAPKGTPSAAIRSLAQGFERAWLGVQGLLKNPELMDEFKRMGGHQDLRNMVSEAPRAQGSTRLGKTVKVKDWYSDRLGFLPQRVQDAVRKIGEGGEKAAEGLKVLADFSESVGRIGEIQIAKRELRKRHPDWSEADIARQAAFEARDLMDFSQRGNADAVRVMRQLIPFSSSSLTGNYKLARALFSSDVPGKAFAAKGAVKSATSGGIMITAPTLALYMYNRDNPHYWMLPQQERDNNWLVPIPGTDGKEFIRLPKPHLYGHLFGTFFERLAASADGDPQAWRKFETVMAENMLPFGTIDFDDPVHSGMSFLSPWGGPLGNAAFEQVANYSTFRRGPVDIQRHFDYKKETYGVDRTSSRDRLTSRAMSHLLHRAKQAGLPAPDMSPVEIEHFLGSIGGGSVDVAMSGTDRLIQGAQALTGQKVSETPKRRPREWLGFKRAPGYTEGEDRLKELRQKMGKEANSADKRGQRYEQRTVYNRLKAAEKRVRSLRGKMRDEKDEKRIIEMHNQIEEITRNALRGTEFAIPER